jgi:mono/diheme cytochrome c family protein
MVPKLIVSNLLWVLFLFASCNSNSKVKNSPDDSPRDGKELYLTKCQSCHYGRDDNTFHQPSLMGMSIMDDSLFHNSWIRMKRDTFHQSMLKNIVRAEDMQLMIDYIRSYKNRAP